MRHVLKLLVLTAGLAAAACDGPRENAGEEADAAANRVGSEDTLRSGPAEEMGARQDAAAESQADAMEARAESIEDSAEEAREAARQQAQALRNDAEAARKVEPAPPRQAEVNGM
jgi:pectin methylesterase-like acyl-CoA thioesterase